MQVLIGCLPNREVFVCMDRSGVWLSKGIEGESMPPAYFPFADNLQLKIVDENTCIFSFMCSDGVCMVLKAKSRSEMSSWKSTLENRLHLTTDNNLIYMAEEHIAHNNNFATMQNFRNLSLLSDFKGTLCNRYN